MSVPPTCPPEGRLRELLAGPSSTDHEELVRHLDDCDACRRTLEKLTGATPALLEAVGAAGSHAYAAEVPLRRVLDDLGNGAPRRRSTVPEAGRPSIHGCRGRRVPSTRWGGSATMRWPTFSARAAWAWCTGRSTPR